MPDIIISASNPTIKTHIARSIVFTQAPRSPRNYTVKGSTVHLATQEAPATVHDNMHSAILQRTERALPLPSKENNHQLAADEYDDQFQVPKQPRRLAPLASSDFEQQASQGVV